MRIVILAVAALIAVVAFTVLLPKLADVFETVVQDVAESLGKWAYLLVGAMAMLETAAALGFIAPGEFAVIIGGVLAGEGTLSIELLIGIVWFSIVIGDTIGFFIGRKLGRSFVDRHGKRFPTARRHFARVEQLFRDHGGKSIFLGRWISIARPLVPFTAGTSGMSYRAFLPYDVIGAGVWGTAFSMLGYIFYRNFDQLTDLASKGALVFAALIVTIIVVVRVAKRLRDPAERKRWKAWIARQAERPALRPCARPIRWVWRRVLRPIWDLVAPPVRFFRGRLTPGELGIELTTLVAIAGVGAYVIFLQIGLIENEPLIAGDATALDISRDTQSGLLTGLARFASALGALPLVLLAVGVTTGFLFGRRRYVEAATLISGFVVTEVAVHVMKSAVGRSRPDDMIVGATGNAYPSGHAAISIGFVAIGVLIARTCESATVRIAWVVGGVGMAVAIGLSRVYLRVHNLSDVIGGWMLGLTVFALLGAIALIVDFIIRVGPPEKAPD